MRKRGLAVAAMVLFLAAPSSASMGVLSMDHVELKTVSGQWISVIRPDKAVDPSRGELTAAFFNNKGRVPAGEYVNVRLTITNASERSSSHVSAKADFSPPIAVKKGSFVKVSYRTDDSFLFLVDDDKRVLSKEDVAITD